MHNLDTKNTIEKTANQLAAEEKRFNSKSLSEEIEPLLKEYFIGGVRLDGDAIIIDFKNGQKFRLIAEQLN